MDSATQLMTDMAPVTGAMLVLGAVLKHLLPVNNKWIPLATLVLGVLAYLVWTGDWTGRGAILAIYAAAAATGLHQAVRQTQSPPL
jgi:hypothetical protein